MVVTKLWKGEEAISSECPVIVGEKCKPWWNSSAPTTPAGIPWPPWLAFRRTKTTTPTPPRTVPRTTRRTPRAISGHQRARAPAKPEVPHVRVARDKGGNPDWRTLAEARKAEINKAPDVVFGRVGESPQRRDFNLKIPRTHARTSRPSNCAGRIVPGSIDTRAASKEPAAGSVNKATGLGNLKWT